MDKDKHKPESPILNFKQERDIAEINRILISFFLAYQVQAIFGDRAAILLLEAIKFSYGSPPQVRQPRTLFGRLRFRIGPKPRLLHILAALLKVYQTAIRPPKACFSGHKWVPWRF